MKTRLIIMLFGGEYISGYYPTREDAEAELAAWCDRQKKRLAEGKVNVLEDSFLYGPPDGPVQFAALGRAIIGMYIPPDVADPTPAERVAAAIEKIHDQGDEWKGGQS
jgi:hypothetical protein